MLGLLLGCDGVGGCCGGGCAGVVVEACVVCTGVAVVTVSIVLHDGCCA